MGYQSFTGPNAGKGPGLHCQQMAAQVEDRGFCLDMTRGNDWAYIQKVNKQVADYLFPNRTTQAMMLKMYGEIAELIDNPSSGSEMADIAIMLLDHAERNNVNLAHEVMIKLATNLERTWTVNAMGVAQHIKDKPWSGK